MAEISQEIGREFAYKVKEFLEDTCNFHIPFVAYKAESDQTTMGLLNGEKKIFDLKGSCLKDEPPLEVFIEVKGYSSESNLGSAYKKFIKECFSVWVKQRQIGSQWKSRFLFISSHPFYCSKFKELKTKDFLEPLIGDSEELKAYFDQNIESVNSDFLELVDILFLTPSCELITINYSKFWDLLSKVGVSK